MTTHIMCDLETLTKRPGGIVLAAAFVRFSDEANCTLNLSIPDQESLGLEKDPDTMVWWNDQEAKHPGAWAAATSNPMPLATALPYFLEWIRWAAPDGDFLLWCHGATFDGPILGEVYRRAGVSCPWTEQFWRVQCTRTLFNLSGVNPKDYAVPPPHVALNDAIGQTRAANAALAILARAHSAPQPSPVQQHVQTAPSIEYNDHLCSVCQQPQFITPSGDTCINGHGGAMGV